MDISIAIRNLYMTISMTAGTISKSREVRNLTNKISVHCLVRKLQAFASTNCLSGGKLNSIQVKSQTKLSHFHSEVQIIFYPQNNLKKRK